MEILVINGTESITLPINPPEFMVDDGWNNEEVNINKIGLMTLIGKRGLRSVTIESFFPAQEYGFAITTEHADNPMWYVEKFGEWRGKILTLTMTDTDNYISWPSVIDSFSYGMKDASGDISYSITFKEYKRAAAKRTSKDVSKVTYTTKSGDTLKKIAKNKLGKASYANKAYKQNKTAIDKAVAREVKRIKKKDADKAKAYKLKPILTKSLPKGIKMTMKV